MLAPYKWIKEYAKVTSDPNNLAQKMIMSGNGVENIEYLGEDIVNVVVGCIKKIEKHPDADKLVVCQIDVGDEDLLQIVTGATNVFEGAYVPVAKAVATLPNGVIKKGKLRGVESFGMLCSGEELKLKGGDVPGAEVDGILILENSPDVGTDIRDVFDLKGAVIEFEVGANRPDCLSMIGIAREAAAVDDVDFSLPKTSYNMVNSALEDMVSVEVSETNLCKRYIAAGIKDVKITSSPLWMRTRLREAGIRPINNIVDITNYIMLETGQPMHAFDADKIRDKKIIVRCAKDKEQIKTLDGKVRECTKNMLLICDGQGPIGVAGVMGGEDSEITAETKNVVFECAKFAYGNIRQTSRGLGLSTESSLRFSKGVDASMTMFAMERALTLVGELEAGDITYGMIDLLFEDLTEKELTTTATRVNDLLGTDIPAKEMETLLNKLFIHTTAEGDDLHCKIPLHRNDIKGAADIAEEVARIFGYDNIPQTSAKVSMKRGVISVQEARSDVMANYLCDIGFFECRTYPFIGMQDYKKLGLELQNGVKILNPLGDDTAYMRTTLIPHMLRTVSTNLNMKNSELNLFEISRVFLPIDGEDLPKEVPTLCLAQTGATKDFFTLKGVVENIIKLVCKKEINCQRANEVYLHPGVSATIRIGEKVIGNMGEVLPDVASAYEIDQKTYVAQIDLELLFEIIKEQVTYKQLPKFPAATRDIAVVVDDEIAVGDIIATIKKAGGKRLETAEFASVYSGEQLGEGKKSVACALILRSAEGTLTDAEVDSVMKKVLTALENEFSAVLR